jgi:hypothetical protein
LIKIKNTRKNLRSFAFVCGLFLLLFSLATAQDLPKEIRGYKVHRVEIAVEPQTEKTIAKNESQIFVRTGEPKLIDVSLTRITFEISAEIVSSAQSGSVDFLAFHDFRVNGLAVEVEEYKESFEFRKNQTTTLAKPIRVSISAGQALRGALKEIKQANAEWTVTGRIFVFGRFKKSFLKFKRVVPIEINLKIKNPLNI